MLRRGQTPHQGIVLTKESSEGVYRSRLYISRFSIRYLRGGWALAETEQRKKIQLQPSTGHESRNPRTGKQLGPFRLERRVVLGREANQGRHRAQDAYGQSLCPPERRAVAPDRSHQSGPEAGHVSRTCCAPGRSPSPGRRHRSKVSRRPGWNQRSARSEPGDAGEVGAVHGGREGGAIQPGDPKARPKTQGGCPDPRNALPAAPRC